MQNSDLMKSKIISMDKYNTEFKRKLSALKGSIVDLLCFNILPCDFLLHWTVFY